MGVQLTQLHLSPHSAAAVAQPAFATYYFPSSQSSCLSSKLTKALLFSASCQSPFISGSGGYPNLPRTRYLDVKSRGTGGRSCSRRTVSARLDDHGDRMENYDDDVFLRRLKEIATSCGREQEFAELEREADESEAAATVPFSNTSPLTETEHLLSGLVSPEPSWRDEVVPARVEIRANIVELPLSLRILKQKKRWEEQLISSVTEVAASESTSSSVKRAFSSMVFMIRELQSYAVQMRESLVHKFYDQDLQNILNRVQHELHASFVWLFQQIFSSTPALMLSVMLLLANFTVHSMASAPAIAAPIIPPSSSPSQVVQIQDNFTVQQNKKFDFTTAKASSSGRTVSVNGGMGGGGKARPVAGATDDGRSGGSSYSTVIPDGPPSTSGRTGIINEDGEEVVWKRVVAEAKSMQSIYRAEQLMDSETLQRLVAPVQADIEPDNPVDYMNTELWYQRALMQDPNNPLILANFAQFIYSVLRDIDRAEEYFKKAAGIEPSDAEALRKYASFLWLAKSDTTAAEEMYLEAIAADPGNGYYSASYANFLWNTGGEDTCYPIY